MTIDTNQARKIAENLENKNPLAAGVILELADEIDRLRLQVMFDDGDIYPVEKDDSDIPF